MNKLLEWDTELFLYLNNLGVESWDAFWLYMSEAEVWFPIYALFVALIFRKLKLRKGLIAVLMIILTVLLTDQGATWLFKEQFDRLRPCHVEELIDRIRLVKGRCGGQFGFLSAHASNSFGWSVFVGLLFRNRFRWMLPVLMVWAMFVAYSRVYLGVHYPLDILAGAVYGVLCGYLTYRLYLFIANKYSNESA